MNNLFIQKIYRYLARFRGGIPWLVGAILALVAPLGSDAFQKLLEGYLLDSIEPLSNEQLILYLAYLTSFGIAVFLMFRVTRWAYRPKTRFLHRDETPERRKHLLLFLSAKNSAKPEGMEITGNIVKDLETLNGLKESARNSDRPLQWNWEMPLRMLAHHLGGLKSVTVICSPQSVKDLPEFVRILTPYLSKQGAIAYTLLNGTEGVCWNTIPDSTDDALGIDFEDFDSLSLKMFWAMTEMRKKGIKDKDIAIDFTSGTKVTSVVAATLTYNREIKAQYVSTSTLKVVSYDIVYGTAQVPSIG